MSKSPKASDVLGRMKAAATREKPVTTAEVRQSTLSPEGQPSGAALPSPTAVQKAKPRKVRFTLDLEPDQHKQLKRFALEADADASEVLRALLVLLHSNTVLRNEVLTAISKAVEE